MPCGRGEGEEEGENSHMISSESVGNVAGWFFSPNGKIVGECLVRLIYL